LTSVKARRRGTREKDRNRRRCAMTHVPHELAEEFPEYREKMHELKLADAHFRKLADAYHALNREIHRIETDVAPADDLHHQELRRRRVKLKDEIFGLLKAA
jgi:hypothetical protein